mmetsp:Transcript_20953/g.59246  ORF Transcript_20953/g.59246 Transcript_20953/m.59246 type:complete len:230 (-) Transcript_20953:536-1225(-)
MIMPFFLLSAPVRKSVGNVAASTHLPRRVEMAIRQPDPTLGLGQWAGSHYAVFFFISSTFFFIRSSLATRNSMIMVRFTWPVARAASAPEGTVAARAPKIIQRKLTTKPPAAKLRTQLRKSVGFRSEGGCVPRYWACAHWPRTSPASVSAPVMCVVRRARPLNLLVMPFCRPCENAHNSSGTVFAPKRPFIAAPAATAPATPRRPSEVLPAKMASPSQSPKDAEPAPTT